MCLEMNRFIILTLCLVLASATKTRLSRDDDLKAFRRLSCVKDCVIIWNKTAPIKRVHQVAGDIGASERKARSYVPAQFVVVLKFMRGLFMVGAILFSKSKRAKISEKPLSSGLAHPSKVLFTR